MYIDCKNIKGSYLQDLEELKDITPNYEFDEDVNKDEPDQENTENNNTYAPPSIITKLDETKESKKLGSAEQIFNKIRWDPKYDTSMFTVGYLDRFIGVMEMSFDKFIVNPDPIPFHRIYFFKLNDQIVWDREKKINLLE